MTIILIIYIYIHSRSSCQILILSLSTFVRFLKYDIDIHFLFCICGIYATLWPSFLTYIYIFLMKKKRRKNEYIINGRRGGIYNRKNGKKKPYSRLFFHRLF